MPINEYEFYNGVVLNRLIRKGTIINIDIFPSKSANSFIINGKVGIYIKYSRKVTSPWRFTFKKNHQDEIKIMSELLNKLYLILVCYDDGIVCLEYNDIKKILNQDHEEYEWISASRLKREQYKIQGSDGKLNFKVADSDFPSKIFLQIDK